MVFFFFQAEDGIRDTEVTGVQTCALPIFFLMKLSVVADFTLPMAQVITGSDQAGTYLLECQEYGGFICTFRRYREMRYQIYEPLRQYLEKQLKLKNTTKAVAVIYRRASLAYERAGDLIKAVEMAEKCGDG